MDAHSMWSFEERLQLLPRSLQQLPLARCTPPEWKIMVSQIEHTAQAILDARALYPDCSLADLYDEVTMPVELRRAHQANDKAVMQAYGFWGSVKTESDCVARLMEMYAGMTK